MNIKKNVLLTIIPITFWVLFLKFYLSLSDPGWDYAKPRQYLFYPLPIRECDFDSGCKIIDNAIYENILLWIFTLCFYLIFIKITKFKLIFAVIGAVLSCIFNYYLAQII